jgi:TRAP-type uncharacterized transport system fused permease subunit
VFCLAVLRLPPGVSALYGLGSLIAVTSFQKANRFTWRRVLEGFERAGNTALIVAIICGSVGILITSLTITGATLRGAIMLVQASGGHLLGLLLLAGIASLLLGTGVPAIGSYVLLATTVAPALTKLGVPPIGAHLFVLYWGISHVITPPVGGALYIASSFSGVDIWQQGYEAMKLGIALFVVPFIFCYHPELLMIGDPGAIVLRTVLAVAAMFCVAVSFIGYLGKPLELWERSAFALAALAFIAGTWWTVLTGAIALAGVILAHRTSKLPAASLER